MFGWSCGDFTNMDFTCYRLSWRGVMLPASISSFSHTFFSLPTHHILMLGQDHLASLFDISLFYSLHKLQHTVWALRQAETAIVSIVDQESFWNRIVTPRIGIGSWSAWRFPPLVPLELRQYSDLSRHNKQPQNCIYCLIFFFFKGHIWKLRLCFITRSNLLCLVCRHFVSFLFHLLSTFLLHENMMCNVRVARLFRDSNRN